MLDSLTYNSEDSIPTSLWPRPTDAKIILCHADGDEAASGQLLTILEKRGFSVTVLRGVETNPDRLGEFARKYGAAGLFVICQTERLDAKHAAQLQRIAVASNVPESCILAARVGPELNLKTADAISALFKTPARVDGDGDKKWDDISDDEDLSMDQGSSPSFVRRFRLPLILLIVLLVLAAGIWFFVFRGDGDEEVEVARAGMNGIVPKAQAAETKTETPEVVEQAVEQESNPRAEEPVEEQLEEPIKVEEETSPPPEPEESSAEERQVSVIDEDLLRAALKRRKIRFLDNLAVAKGKRRKLNFKKATEHCEKRETAGITGWRLPTIGELRSLRQAYMVTNGAYWSTTSGDSVDSRKLGLNAGSKRIVILRRDWGRARAICVIDRVSEL